MAGLNIAFPQVIPNPPTEETKWYALQTRARHEKIVAYRLEQAGIEIFLPLVQEVHRWSDRKKIVQLPLFSSYVFAKIRATNAERIRLLQVDGVLSLVGKRAEGTPIPDEQIQSVKVLVNGKMPWTTYPFLKIGQRVRIRNGALEGMEGILLSRSGENNLVVSVDAIQRSLAVRLENYELEAA
jgi:transcription antitermination factor NusG